MYGENIFLQWFGHPSSKHLHIQSIDFSYYGTRKMFLPNIIKDHGGNNVVNTVAAIF